MPGGSSVPDTRERTETDGVGEAVGPRFHTLHRVPGSTGGPACVDPQGQQPLWKGSTAPSAVCPRLRIPPTPTTPSAGPTTCGPLPQHRVNSPGGRGCGPLLRGQQLSFCLPLKPSPVLDVYAEEGAQVEAERHELVTLFFSDIVGFTGISQALSPEKVVLFMHEVACIICVGPLPR